MILQSSLSTRDEVIYLMEKRCCHSGNVAALQEIKALNEGMNDDERTSFTIRPHGRSGTDRMQRRRTEEEINECNVITWTGMMAVTGSEGLKTQQQHACVMALWRGMEMGLSRRFFSDILPPLVQRGGGYATTCTEKSGGEYQLIHLPF